MSGTTNEKEPGSPAESTQNNQLVKDTEMPEKRKREYKDFGHEEAAPTRKFPYLFCQFSGPRFLKPFLLDANVDMGQVRSVSS